MKAFTFKSDNKPGDQPCPICGTAQAEDAILIGIQNNREPDSQNLRACQVHIHCLAQKLIVYPWEDGRTIIVGSSKLEHFERGAYGITY